MSWSTSQGGLINNIHTHTHRCVHAHMHSHVCNFHEQWTLADMLSAEQEKRHLTIHQCLDEHRHDSFSILNLGNVAKLLWAVVCLEGKIIDEELERWSYCFIKNCKDGQILVFMFTLWNREVYHMRGNKLFFFCLRLLVCPSGWFTVFNSIRFPH